MPDGTHSVPAIQAGTLKETLNQLGRVYEDLLIVDSFAAVLSDALHQHCEDYAPHYGNLIDEMRVKLRASYEALDGIGCNTASTIEALGVSHA